MEKKILIVDDEKDIRLTLGSLLQSNHFDIDEAEDGEICLKKLDEDSFDLMILDLLMPNVDGYQVIKTLTANKIEEMPVIILTAKNEDKDVLQGYALGASYYITKPFDNKTVLNAVNYLIGELTPRQKRKIENTL